MMPCSSGNSPTMSVSKSALARRAAMSASCARWSLPICAPTTLAMARTRSMRSPCVPSLLWYTTFARPGTRDSSDFLRSWSKKNLASARRGRTTRSLPPITAPASEGLMLLTTRNLWVSLPCASSSGKYFWLAFIVRMRHSCGTARNSSSNWQTSTLGLSTSAVTSSSRASSAMGLTPPPTLAAAASSWRRISARRESKPGITAPRSCSVAA